VGIVADVPAQFKLGEAGAELSLSEADMTRNGVSTRGFFGRQA
jgi:hypothetical protein